MRIWSWLCWHLWDRWHYSSVDAVELEMVTPEMEVLFDNPEAWNRLRK